MAAMFLPLRTIVRVRPPQITPLSPTWSKKFLATENLPHNNEQFFFFWNIYKLFSCSQPRSEEYTWRPVWNLLNIHFQKSLLNRKNATSRGFISISSFHFIKHFLLSNTSEHLQHMGSRAIISKFCLKLSFSLTQTHNKTVSVLNYIFSVLF